MSKKKIFLIALSAIIAALALVAALLLFFSIGKKTDAYGAYEYRYEQEFTDKHDADMTIDGNISENRWQDKQWLIHRQDGVTLRYTSTLTEMGVYVAAVAEDTDIRWAARLDFSRNSCFTIYVTREGERKMHPMRALRFDVDCLNSRSYNQNRFEAKASVAGSVNSGNTEKITAELFVSWKSLHIDISNGLPAAVRISPLYRKIFAKNPKNNKNISTTFNRANRPFTYFRFGAAGYLNPDSEGAVIGDAGNGMVKSDGWDVSREGEGSVRSVGESTQAIFFKGVLSSDYDVQATLRPVGARNSTVPHAGIVAFADDINFRTFYLSAKNILAGSPFVQARAMTQYPDGGWYETDFVTAAATGTGSETVRVIKRGAVFYYFIGGKFVQCEQVENLAGKVVPGLFALGCEAVFTNYSVKDYQSDTAALDRILSEYVFQVETPGENGGGSVTASAPAVVPRGEVTITVLPRPGFILSAFSINGLDSLAELRAGISEGEYRITGISEDLKIEAAFIRLDATVRVTGRLRDFLGKYVAAGSVSAVSADDSLLYHGTVTDEDGSFALDLAPAGTETAGGRLSGKYTLIFAAEGQRRREISVTITKNVDLGDVVLDGSAVGGGASLSDGTRFESDLHGWDLSEEYLGAVTARGGSNVCKLYFNDIAGSRATIAFTVENRTPNGIGYEGNPGAGITFMGKNCSLTVLAMDTRLMIMPNGVWSEGVFYSGTGYDLREKNVPVTFRMVKQDSMLAVYLVHADGTATELYCGEELLPEGECAFALTVTQTYECAVRFSEYSARTAFGAAL